MWLSRTNWMGIQSNPFMGAGKTQFGRETVPSVKASGICSLNETTVIGPTQVSGILTAIKAKLNTLEVSGTSTLRETQVQNHTTITGPLNVIDSLFHTIAITSNIAFFKNSSTKDITVKPTDGEQTIDLDNTIVTGFITFEKPGGKIFISHNSTITGEVTNGVVLQKY